MHLKFKFPLLSLLLVSICLLSGCVRDTCEQETTYTKLTPVFVNMNEVRAAPIRLEEPRELEFPGKLYIYGDLLLINERNEGVHFINNSDPSAPDNFGFLEVGGNTDFVIRNNVLFLNQYTDLIGLDISNPQQIQLVNRTEDVTRALETNRDGEIASFYHAAVVTEILDCNARQRIDRWGGWGCWNCEFLAQSDVAFDANFASGDVSNIPSVGTGTGGSMARFTLFQDHLYTVDQTTLKAYTFSGDQPSLGSETQLWWGIETIIPYGDHLFIGSQSGMFIFEASNPAEPTQVSVFQHARACDPVYVNGDRAYVTLRDGTPCDGFINQLDVVNISNIENPTLSKTFPMEHPHGLGILDETLYLCEGDFGLKAFDITDPLQLDKNQLMHLENFNAYDVIPLGGEVPTLLVIGDDGFVQLDITDPEAPVTLSTIPVKRN